MQAKQLPEPMRVSDEIIDRCRIDVESKLKRTVRSAVVPFVKFVYKFQELGEGFQWGRPLGVAEGQVRVGRYVYIGAYGSIIGPLVIGDLCMLSTHVRFIGNDHRTDVTGSPMRLEFAEVRPLTTIEADCWVGQGAMIREGVTIGRGAIVGAGALITKSVAPYSIVAGNPARILRMRFSEHEIAEHDRILFGTKIAG